MATLKDRAVSGIKWQVANKVLQKVISVATFAVLARILEPSVFGLFAMAFIAIDGLGLFKSFGIDAAIIRRKDAPDIANDTAFFMILFLGIMMAVLCYFAAPVAAYFFKNQDVDSLIRALGAVFIVGCFGRIPSALLTKSMRFRAISIIELSGAAVNSFFAIGFVLLNPSVWSLVWAYVIKTLVMTVLSWRFSGYRLRWQFSPALAREFLDFGKFMVGMSLLGYVSVNMNNIAVGKMLGAALLGYYALANNIGGFINTHFTFLISRVIFPAYSAMQNDKEALKRAYLKTVKFVSMVSLPFSIALICLAREFTLTLYGDKWLPIVPLVQLFGVIQIVVPIMVCSGPLFIACNKPELKFRLDLAGLVIKLPILIWFINVWGVIGTVLSGLVMVSIFAPINVIVIQKLVGFKYKEVFEQLMSSIACSMIMLGAILLSKVAMHSFTLSFLSAHQVVPLFVVGLLGLTAYLISFLAIDPAASTEARRMIFGVGKASAL